VSAVVTSVSLSGTPRAARHLLGVRSGGWSAVVDGRGGIVLGDLSLAWWVMAEDRWHDPATDQGVRQQRTAGVPCTETRVRVPGGDVVQRAWAVPDAGGMVVVEFHNDSPSAVAVALSPGGVLASRPLRRLAAGEAGGAPADSAVLPIAHGTSARVALPVVRGAAADPARVAGFDDVRRGWLAALERASWLDLPDPQAAPAVNRARADALILGVRALVPAGDPVDDLLVLHELVRLGERPDERTVDACASAAESLLRGLRRSAPVAWDAERALFAASDVLLAAGERRAADDVARSQRRLAPAEPAPDSRPTGIRAAAWTEQELVRPSRDGTADVLVRATASWTDRNLQCRGVFAGPGRRASFALRWHMGRPALLWETEPGTGTVLRAPALDPSWSSASAAGEVLLLGSPA